MKIKENHQINIIHQININILMKIIHRNLRINYYHKEYIIILIINMIIIIIMIVQ